MPQGVSATNPLRTSTFQLDQVPLVALEILKDVNRSIAFLARFIDKLHAARRQHTTVAPEVVGVEKQKDEGKADSSLRSE
jgi:hypothetical protein